MIDLSHIFETKTKINNTVNEEEKDHLQQYLDCMVQAELDGTANAYREYYNVS